MRREKIINETLDHLLTTIGGFANPEEYENESDLGSYANDYIRDKYNVSDVDELTREVVKRYLED